MSNAIRRKFLIASDVTVAAPLSQFHLVVNQKTARELGLKIPQSILLRADRVIE